MFDIFGRKRILELENELKRVKSIKESEILNIFSESGFIFGKHIELELKSVEIQGYKDRIMKLEKLLNFVTVNKPAKRRNDVLLASLACGKSTVTPVMEYLKRKGIKDPDGGDYRRSTVQDILKPPATK